MTMKERADRALARFRARNRGAQEREKAEKEQEEKAVAERRRLDYLRRTGRTEMKP